jgi:jumonji domain-containing protein 7
MLIDGALADNSSDEVHYLQSQNGNIYRHSYEQETQDETAPELAAFQEYIEPEVEFLSEALGMSVRLLRIRH